MLNKIDRLIDGITMYRLVLYYLAALILIAVILGFLGILSYAPFSILFSTIFILVTCYITNTIFAHVFEVPVNAESWIITGLILSLILSPSTSYHAMPLYFWASVLAISPKYMFAIKKRHVFNPAAAAVALTAIGLDQAASWWVGTAWMAPFVVIGGLLVVRKIRRFSMVFTFLTAAVLSTFLFHGSSDPIVLLKKIALDSSLLFLAFVMLTEPLTTPPVRKMQMVFGAIVGLLFPPQVHLFNFFSTPELALLAGNCFSYLVSPKEKFELLLSQKIQIGADMMDFIFKLDKKLSFTPGQYMEWTVPHNKMDSRGNRRYFTIASSPTEDSLRLGVKFYPNGSSYKKAMQSMTPGSKIIGGQLAGDFVLPDNENKKLVFVAGGIGVTPYRAILKYLLDTNKKRDIIVLYSNKLSSEIMYKDILDEAYKKLGVKTVYTLTEDNSPSWKGRKGRIDAKMISEEIPDFKERIFYLSGPHPMVVAFEQTLKEMGISPSQIKIDFFPGYA